MKPRIHVSVLALLVAIHVLAACAAPPPQATLVFGTNVTVEEAYTLQEQGALLLDVRTLEEWDEAHIPGATLIPLDQLEGRVGEVPADIPVVVYCRSGNRSLTGLAILQAAGFSNAHNMLGGINAWVASGLPTE